MQLREEFSQVSENSTSLSSASKSAINELIQASGKVEEKYQRLSHCVGRDVSNPGKRWRDAFIQRPLKDNISINPIPLILGSAEQATIQRGMTQLGRLLHSFIADVMLGTQNSFTENGGCVPRRLLEMIFEKAHSLLSTQQALWRGKTPVDVALLFRPDRMRDADGVWRVIEVNIGPLGGLADLKAIHEFFHSAIGMKARSALSAGYLSPPEILPDMLSAIRQSTGRVPIVSSCISARRARIEMLKPKSKKYDMERLREVIAVDEAGIQILPPHSAEAICLAAPEKCFLVPLEFSADRKLFACEASRQIMPPSVDLFGHKALLPYLSGLAETLLGEELILNIQPSKNVCMKNDRSRANYSFVPYFSQDIFPAFSFYDQLVIKDPNSDQGEGILMGALAKSAFTLVCEDALGWPEDLKEIESDLYVAQDQILASTIENCPIDISVHGCAWGDGNVYVSEVPWGRSANPQDKKQYDGPALTNVSQRGHEVVVLVER